MEKKPEISIKPQWLKKRIKLSETREMHKLLRNSALHTICEEARCPNLSECFSQKQASFLILGDICTRGCLFCGVNHNSPLPPDSNEPDRLANTISSLQLTHVVITSPTRDDLSDGGAGHFVKCIEAVRKVNKNIHLEVLVPDFQGREESLYNVLDASPDILSHNVETVPRLYRIRTGADYQRSIDLFKSAHNYTKKVMLKSGLMLGLGENEAEVNETIVELFNSGCTLLSLGQYLAPTNRSYQVQEFINPVIFEKYKKFAINLGFTHVESGPYVRSSYNAHRYAKHQMR
jgi:lipoic acid synthetase